MSDPFVAEIRLFPYNFAPRNWALCNGQTMPINQNAALFSLLGTSFGGNGQSNFQLPNLQGAVPLGTGQGPGLSAYALGQSGGSASVTLQTAQTPAHSHSLTADAETSTSASLQNAILMEGHFTGTATGKVAAYNTAAPDTAMNPAAITATGGGGPHNNMMPYLAFNFCIALMGIYPPRS